MSPRWSANDAEVQTAVQGWKREHRRLVVVLGALYALTLVAALAAAQRSWPDWTRTQTRLANVLELLPIFVLPVGGYFFYSLWVYRRGLRILALGQLLPARRQTAATWLRTSVYYYESGGTEFMASGPPPPRSQAAPKASPVVFIDPASPRRGIVVWVGAERG